MNKKILVIEIGDRLTKVGVISRKKNVVQTHLVFHFTTPSGCVLDGFIMQPDLFAETLKQYIEQYKLQQIKDVIFTVRSSRIISRDVEVPYVPKNRLRSLIMANVDDYFPLDLSTYEVSYSVIGNEKEKGKTPTIHVLITVAPGDILKSYVELAEATNLELDSIDHSANSQFQLVKQLPLPGNVMYVAISPQQMLATFVTGGNFGAQRTFPVGGEEILESALAMGTMEERDSFAESIDLSYQQEWMDSKLSKEEMADASFRLVNGVTRSVEFFKNTQKVAVIETIVLLDSCAAIAGLKDLIQEAVSINTKVLLLHEVTGIESITKCEDVTGYASCLGALYDSLDMLPSSGKKAAREQKDLATKKVLSWVGTIVLCILPILIMFIYGVYQNVQENMRMQMLERQKEDLLYVQEIYDAYIQFEGYEVSMTNLENATLNSNSRLIDFLTELEIKMPENLLLLSANCSETSVAMDIEVTSMYESAVVISQFRTFESIESLVIGAISEVEGEEHDVVSFSITANYVGATEEEFSSTLEPETTTEVGAEGEVF